MTCSAAQTTHSDTAAYDVCGCTDHTQRRLMLTQLSQRYSFGLVNSFVVEHEYVTVTQTNTDTTCTKLGHCEAHNYLHTYMMPLSRSMLTPSDSMLYQSTQMTLVKSLRHYNTTQPSLCNQLPTLCFHNRVART